MEVYPSLRASLPDDKRTLRLGAASNGCGPLVVHGGEAPEHIERRTQVGRSSGSLLQVLSKCPGGKAASPARVGRTRGAGTSSGGTETPLLEAIGSVCFYRRRSGSAFGAGATGTGELVRQAGPIMPGRLLSAGTPHPAGIAHWPRLRSRSFPRLGQLAVSAVGPMLRWRAAARDERRGGSPGWSGCRHDRRGRPP